MAGTTTTPGSAALARTPHATPSTVASALSHAFLQTDDWSQPGLVRAGAVVLGVRRRWLPRVVAEVLGFYHRPPRDAHRELAAVIELSDTFRAAVERSVEQRRPIRIARYVVGAGHGAEHAVLPLNDLADLTRLLGLTPGQLDWFSDTRHWNRRASSGSLQHYRYEWRARAGRLPRLLEVPRPRLREVQRKVLSLILSRLAVHDAAHGFVPGRSAATGARPHEGARVLINLDLSTFFTRVTAGRVYGVLRQEGFPEAVAHTITGLCTHSVPPRLVTAAPSGGRLDERFALRQALAVPHLPQGAPSSPMLANLAVRRLDRRLTGWAEAAGAVYTRYADDLAFSGGDDLTRRAGAFIRGVRRIVEDEGHFVNARKTRVSGWSVRQSVTGIVVNEHTNVTRSEFDRLKAVLHNCVLHGPGSQNRSGHHDFRSHLRGRIAWVAMLNPARGAKLRETFDRILW